MKNVAIFKNFVNHNNGNRNISNYQHVDNGVFRHIEGTDYVNNGIISTDHKHKQIQDSNNVVNAVKSVDNGPFSQIVKYNSHSGHNHPFKLPHHTFKANQMQTNTNISTNINTMMTPQQPQSFTPKQQQQQQPHLQPHPQSFKPQSFKSQSFNQQSLNAHPQCFPQPLYVAQQPISRIDSSNQQHQQYRHYQQYPQYQEYDQQNVDCCQQISSQRRIISAVVD